MPELMDPGSDFSSIAFSEDYAERICRWFGITAFVLLTPLPPVNLLDSQEMTKMQGSLCIALGNSGCELPGFVCRAHAPKPSATSHCPVAPL